MCRAIRFGCFFDTKSTKEAKITKALRADNLQRRLRVSRHATRALGVLGVPWCLGVNGLFAPAAAGVQP
jgi:hypothetical protein